MTIRRLVPHTTIQRRMDQRDQRISREIASRQRRAAPDAVEPVAIGDLPVYDPNARTAEPKPKKGEAWLDRKQDKRELKAHEDREMTAARKRDMAACHGCRWPGCQFMPEKPRLEVSHCFEHRGMGGNPTGDRTQKRLLMLLCFLCHARLDAGDASVEALSHLGSDGPCAFFLKHPETGRLEHVASERSIGVSEERS